MKAIKSWKIRGNMTLVLAGVLAAAGVVSAEAASPPATCTKVKLAGEVNEGQEWKTAIGEGWVVRMVPVAPGKAGYSGWDLVVDRAVPAGFPDALLLATPPYESINEREVGTTFGLRAQDAIGWNPRSFKFLTSPAALLVGQKLYADLHASGERNAHASERLMTLVNTASPGELRILNARIVPGTGDAPPFAERWAIASARTPHSVVPQSGASTERGRLAGISFALTLWLPAGWRAPAGANTNAACAP